MKIPPTTDLPKNRSTRYLQASVVFFILWVAYFVYLIMLDKQLPIHTYVFFGLLFAACACFSKWVNYLGLLRQTHPQVKLWREYCQDLMAKAEKYDDRYEAILGSKQPLSEEEVRQLEDLSQKRDKIWHEYKEVDKKIRKFLGED